jgi:hypothetical protein
MLLSEADRCKEHAKLGALLRRKRIYCSMLSSNSLGLLQFVNIQSDMGGANLAASCQACAKIKSECRRIRHMP